MILHTINKSPFSHQCFNECLRFINPQDSVLLIEDGVYAAKADSAPALQLQQLCATINCYVLAPDCSARGLDAQLSSRVTPIEDRDFVRLVTQHQSVQSWY